LAAVFLRAARRGLGAELLLLATSPVGSLESPAFTRSFCAISAISSIDPPDHLYLHVVEALVLGARLKSVAQIP